MVDLQFRHTTLKMLLYTSFCEACPEQQESRMQLAGRSGMCLLALLHKEGTGLHSVGHLQLVPTAVRAEVWHGVNL